MINFEEYLKTVKVGDVLTIEEHPKKWSDGAGGINKLHTTEYPYTLTVESIHITEERYFDAGYKFISFKDTNGYGWTINTNNCKIFTKHPDRKSRIESLQL